MISNIPFLENRENRTFKKERGEERERRENGHEDKCPENLSLLQKERWIENQGHGLQSDMAVNELNDHGTIL